MIGESIRQIWVNVFRISYYNIFRESDASPVTEVVESFALTIAVAVLAVIVALFIALTVFVIYAFRKDILCFKGE